MTDEAYMDIRTVTKLLLHQITYVLRIRRVDNNSLDPIFFLLQGIRMQRFHVLRLRVLADELPLAEPAGGNRVRWAVAMLFHCVVAAEGLAAFGTLVGLDRREFPVRRASVVSQTEFGGEGFRADATLERHHGGPRDVVVGFPCRSGRVTILFVEVQGGSWR
jgi:hypothetical protein